MKKWLFYPFEFLAGWSALFMGLIIMLITALVAAWGNVHLDGVLDLHLGNTVSFFIALAEGLANWLSMAACIYVAGLIFSKSSIRFIDVLGTQVLARAPFLLACLLSLLGFDKKILQYIEYKFMQKGTPVTIGAGDVIGFGFNMLVTIMVIIWTIVLMYQAYSIACNVKGNKGIFSFMGALIFAEVISKVVINLFII